jgi:predicted metal-dependent phosphoesterase TrpH
MQKIVYADLHTHTTASDGTLTPTQLVEWAKELGLKALAITDHDTVGGVEEAMNAAKNTGVQVVPGIEISCGWDVNDYSIHMLGLFVDPNNKELVTFLERQKEARFTRAHRILQLLEKEGIDTRELAEEFNERTEKVLGRPHIARYLIEKGVVSCFQEAFDRYLLRGCPAYVPKEKVHPKDAIALIHKAGGFAALAHPGLTSKWDRVWPEIEGLPWEGMEVFYSEHSEQQVEYFYKLARARGIVPTGGSDFHGDFAKETNALGASGLNEEQFNEVVEAHKKRLNQ